MFLEKNLIEKIRGISPARASDGDVVRLFADFCTGRIFGVVCQELDPVEPPTPCAVFYREFPEYDFESGEWLYPTEADILADIPDLINFITSPVTNPVSAAVFAKIVG